MPARLITLLLACGCLLSCDQNSSDGDGTVYPVWILIVQVRNSLTQLPVEQCARVVWEIRGSDEIHTTDCDLQYLGIDQVKVWQSIHEPLVVDYHVECDGYRPGSDRSAQFDPELAYVHPGAPGAEDIERVIVSLTPE